MKVIKPNALRPGDTIGVVAPAFPFPTDENSEYYKQYLKGKAELEDMGFQIKESKNLRNVQWWRAGTPKERAEDLNTFFKDPEIKAIIAHDGGNDCISVLEYLDYEIIKSNPKPLIGFSNITNLHSAIFSKVGMVGFHMGLLTYELGWAWQDLEPQNKEKGKELFRNVLTRREPLGSIEPLSLWNVLKEGTAQGKLFGGNLSMLDSLIGTPYFPTIESLKGCIFFWEIDNSPSYRIERVLTHLKYIGLFDVISAMVIGKLVDIKTSAIQGFVEPTTDEIVLEVLKDYSFPIISDVDFGHKMVQIPMPIGVEAEIRNGSLVFLESAVC